jgi:Sulfotransferase family
MKQGDHTNSSQIPDKQNQTSWRGYIDDITSNAIIGWVCDLNDLNFSPEVDIIVNDIKIGTICANEYRPDVKLAGFGNGCHGFVYNFKNIDLIHKKVKIVIHNSNYEIPLSGSCLEQSKIQEKRNAPLIEVVSVHIPKTAGTTFANCLKKIYDQSIYFDYGLDYSSPQFFYPFDIPPNFKLIHGHFPVFKYEKYFTSAKRVTWLRDPIKMLISLYNHWRVVSFKNDASSLQKKVREGEVEFTNFIEYPQCQDLLCIYTNNNLSLFDFVGITEFFQEDFNELRAMMNWPETEISYKNKNWSLDYQKFVSEIFGNRELIKKIEHYNEGDIYLYQTALQLRRKRQELH